MGWIEGMDTKVLHQTSNTPAMESRQEYSSQPVCRVPEELKRHSISDGEGGHYSTNLDRNRYGSDDQYLATVVRYNLDYLDLCPCLVSITILDAKGGNETTTVSVDPCACVCSAGASRIPGPVRVRSKPPVSGLLILYSNP